MESKTGIHGANSARHGRGRGRWGATSRFGAQEIWRSNEPQTKSSVRTPPDPMAHHRKLNLMASVSRSSGLEKDGDDLKNWGIQDEYRQFIQEKLDNISQSRGKSLVETGKERKNRLENQENVLILFRKLREGVASSDRNDAFALEVYETSLYLSIVFESPKQTTSIVPHLFPPESDPKYPASSRSASKQHQPSIHSVFCSLLHHLVAYYPSQGPYHQHLHSINKFVLPREPGVYTWFSCITKCLRTRNYAKLAPMTQKSTVLEIISRASKTSNVLPVNSTLGLDALLYLLDTLRQKAAETTWNVLRSAYREFSLDLGAEGTKLWLVRSLSLESVYDDDRSMRPKEWAESKVSVGYVRRKEGFEDRWIVCKVR